MVRSNELDFAVDFLFLEFCFRPIHVPNRVVLLKVFAIHKQIVMNLPDIGTIQYPVPLFQVHVLSFIRTNEGASRDGGLCETSQSRIPYVGLF